MYNSNSPQCYLNLSPHHTNILASKTTLCILTQDEKDNFNPHPALAKFQACEKSHRSLIWTDITRSPHYTIFLQSAEAVRARAVSEFLSDKITELGAYLNFESLFSNFTWPSTPLANPSE